MISCVTLCMCGRAINQAALWGAGGPFLRRLALFLDGPLCLVASPCLSFAVSMVRSLARSLSVSLSLCASGLSRTKAEAHSTGLPNGIRNPKLLSCASLDFLSLALTPPSRFHSFPCVACAFLVSSARLLRWGARITDTDYPNCG